ncbi:hypothetical protein PoB_007495000 [Plakobranchus ocellatus]|uniref:Uncharacterized protein n=1 Tax=Plakobranchus ocellatus TaxID=259542 RepID=A0AAV4DWB4_9GAST|nr:hypothetical protein PoB_007495000 [Plakobranchus ocellatus]
MSAWNKTNPLTSNKRERVELTQATEKTDASILVRKPNERRYEEKKAHQNTFHEKCSPLRRSDAISLSAAFPNNKAILLTYCTCSQPLCQRGKRFIGPKFAKLVVVGCPTPDCSYRTSDEDASVVAALLNIYALTHAQASAPLPPKLDRLKIDIEKVWNNFARRLKALKSGSGLSEATAPSILFQCALRALATLC